MCVLCFGSFLSGEEGLGNGFCSTGGHNSRVRFALGRQSHLMILRAWDLVEVGWMTPRRPKFSHDRYPLSIATSITPKNGLLLRLLSIPSWPRSPHRRLRSNPGSAAKALPSATGQAHGRRSFLRTAEGIVQCIRGAFQCWDCMIVSKEKRRTVADFI